MKMKINW